MHRGSSTVTWAWRGPRSRKRPRAKGPQATLASAAAGLTLLFSDRAGAREHLLRARKGGQVMVAEIGLSTKDVLEGQMTPAVIPPSVSSASAEELDCLPACPLPHLTTSPSRAALRAS